MVTRRKVQSSGLLTTGFLLFLATVSCAPAPDPLQGPKPRDCRLEEAGYVQIPVEWPRRSLQKMLRERGYDGIRNRRAIRDVGGSERIVAWEGTGLRWNKPACRFRFR